MHSEEVWKILHFCRLLWLYSTQEKRNFQFPLIWSCSVIYFLQKPLKCCKLQEFCRCVQLQCCTFLTFRSTFGYATKIFSPYVYINKVQQPFCKWRVSNVALISWKCQTYGFPLAKLLMTYESYRNQRGRHYHFPYADSKVHNPGSALLFISCIQQLW